MPPGSEQRLCWSFAIEPGGDWRYYCDSDAYGSNELMQLDGEYRRYRIKMPNNTVVVYRMRPWLTMYKGKDTQAQRRINFERVWC